MPSGKEPTVSNVQLTTTLTPKESVAKFILNVKSSTKTSESANNVMRDMDSTMEFAPSFLLESKSILDAKPGTDNTIALNAQLDSSSMPMESAHQYLTNVENGTKKLEIVLPATLDMLLIKANASEIPTPSSQLPTLFAKHSIAITTVLNVLTGLSSTLIEFVLQSVITAIPGML